MKILTLDEVKRLIANLRDVFAYIAVLRNRDGVAIHIQNPKIPSALSQSLAAYLLQSGNLLGERMEVWPSNSGGDLCGRMASGVELTIEVKATGESAFQELGRKDLEAGLLIWLHFASFFSDPSRRSIDVWLMPNPGKHLKGPCKLLLKTFQRSSDNGVFGGSVDLDDLFRELEESRETIASQ